MKPNPQKFYNIPTNQLINGAMFSLSCDFLSFRFRIIDIHADFDFFLLFVVCTK